MDPAQANGSTRRTGEGKTEGRDRVRPVGLRWIEAMGDLARPAICEDLGRDRWSRGRSAPGFKGLNGRKDRKEDGSR